MISRRKVTSRKTPILVVLSLSLALLQQTQVSAAEPNPCEFDRSPTWVAQENSKVGDWQWDEGIPIALEANVKKLSPTKHVSRLAKTQDARSQRPIEGWFSSSSAQCGQSVGLHISSAGRYVDASIFRIGYYAGAGARLIERVKIKVPDLTPQEKAAPILTTEDASNWPVAWSLKVTKKTPPGEYVVRLDASHTEGSFVPLVITDKGSRNAISFLSSALTWQAYNKWGGRSLYSGADGKADTRATIANFARPYAGDGAGQARYMECPLIFLAEKVGLDLNYASDMDLDSGGAAIESSRSIILSGHAEYWTTAMRANLEKSIARGANLISLGGNSIYNRPIVDRVSNTTSNTTSESMSMWRWGGPKDPHANDPLLASTAWRIFPILNPESLLLGSQYLGITPVTDLHVAIGNPWPFNVLPAGDILRNVVGTEIDSPLYSPGPSIQELASAKVVVRTKDATMMSTYFVTSSGAAILDIGTDGWVCSIANNCPWKSKSRAVDSEKVARVTENILDSLRTNQLAVIHPPTLNVHDRNIFFDEWAGIVELN